MNAKQITLKCPCGATATFADESGSFINSGGAPDNKGRVFRIDVQSDDWLDRHKECIRRASLMIGSQ